MISAIIGWGIGIPLVVAGVLFHFWKKEFVVKMRVVSSDPSIYLGICPYRGLGVYLCSRPEYFTIVP